MIERQTLLHALGYDAFTPMQEEMDSATEVNKGVVLLSPTGSGKTLAYLLPLVRLVSPLQNSLQAVVIVPTRELATQSEQMLKKMKTSIRSLSLYGGRPTMQEHRVIREIKPQVVFATPGRLNDHLGKENLNPLGVKLLVIDEFDKCLELGFQNEMNQAIAHFVSIESCWLTSATDADDIPLFMNRVVSHFAKLNYLGETKELAQRIREYSVASPIKDKLQTLGNLLTFIKGRPAIVFVSHRESAERVGKWLKENHFSSVVYHGGMEQEMREKSLFKFRNQSANILVSTDLAARGLDIPEVEVIIHYHLPLKSEEYTHRNGRTARWNAQGEIYIILSPDELLPPFAEKAENLILPEVPICPTPSRYETLYIGRGKSDKLSKTDVLGFLCKKGNLRSTDIGRIDVAPHAAYVAVARSEIRKALQQMAGEKIKGMKTIIEKSK